MAVKLIAGIFKKDFLIAHTVQNAYTCYLATSPLYRVLYVQLAGSGLRSTQNVCTVGDLRSSNQEKQLDSAAGWALHTKTKH